MPANWADTPEKEQAWQRAKKIFKDQTDKSESNWGESEWAQVMSIAKNIYKNESVGFKEWVAGQSNQGNVPPELKKALPSDLADLAVDFGISNKGEFIKFERDLYPSEVQNLASAMGVSVAQIYHDDDFEGDYSIREENSMKKSNVIEIKEEVQINEDVVLEVGDRIEVLNEDIKDVKRMEALINRFGPYDFSYIFIDYMVDMGLVDELKYLLKTIEKRG